MRRGLAALAALVLSVGGALAQAIEVSADVMQVDDKARQATFAGSVVIVRAGMKMWADHVLVNYGAGGETDVDQMVATGSVKIETDGQTATGGRAVFNPDTQILVLTENVTVTNAQGRVNGPELTINLATNNSVFRGSDGGRVTGVFTPQ
jgi:lipopolysaccharide export system protein LptA